MYKDMLCKNKFWSLKQEDSKPDCIRLVYRSVHLILLVVVLFHKNAIQTEFG